MWEMQSYQMCTSDFSLKLSANFNARPKKLLFAYGKVFFHSWKNFILLVIQTNILSYTKT